MEQTNKIKGLAIEDIKQPNDLKFVSTDTGIDCTILSPTLKALFEKAIKSLNEAKSAYEKFNETIGHNPSKYSHDHFIADTAGKRALTKFKNQSEKSSEYLEYTNAQVYEYEIKKKITDECFKSVVSHNLSIANKIIETYAGVSDFINFATHEEYSAFYEVTLEKSPLEPLAEADRLLKNAGGKGLILRVEFSHDARQSVRCIKLHDEDTVYYWLDIHSSSYPSAEDYHATLNSETKGFRLTELMCASGMLKANAKLHTMTAICQNIIGIEFTLTKFAKMQVYRRTRFSEFKVINAITS